MVRLPEIRHPILNAYVGARCAECEFYKPSGEESAECPKYGIKVKLYMVCDSWKKNPSLPTVFQ